MRDGSTSRGAGGTSGGIGTFVMGVMMAIAGAYLLTNRVVVMSNPWTVFGFSTFGLSLVPLCFGIGILFFNGRSPLGWLLALGGVVIIGAGVIMNLQVFFQPTSLFNTLVMLVLLCGGLGMVARSLRAR